MKRASRRAAAVLFLSASACNALLGIDPLATGPDDASVDATEPTTSDSGSPSKDASADVGLDARADTGTDAGDQADAPCVIPDGSSCSPYPQCSCGADRTCAHASVGFGCVDAGDVALGGQCGGSNLCAPGLACFSGLCHETCGVPGASCAGGTTCVAVRDFQSVPIPYWDMCMHTDCDLLDAASCGAPASSHVGCVYARTDQASDCVQQGTSTSACSSATDCVPGMVCVIDDAGTMCRPWCRIATPQCDAGQTCDSYGGSITIAGVRWGICH